MSRFRYVMSFPFLLLRDLYQLLISHLPGPTGETLRRRYWSSRLRHLGRNVIIGRGVIFENPGFTEIGDDTIIDHGVIFLAGIDASSREKKVFANRRYPGEAGVLHIGCRCHIAPSCLISAISGGVFIDDDCSVAAGSRIYAFTHHYRSFRDPADRGIVYSPRVPQDRQCMIVGAIYIARNCGLAVNTIVLPGVTLATCSFVTAGSVLLFREFSENSLVAGNPARRIGDRFRTPKVASRQPDGDEPAAS